MIRLALAAFIAIGCAVSCPLSGQTSGDLAVIDTVIIQPGDIFDEPGPRPWYQRLANALHVHTRRGIIRRELLFRPGEVYDSARVAETARNLRSLRVFRYAAIDTFRVDGRLAARVRTGDGWTTSLEGTLRGSGDDLLWSAGLRENNFLGTLTMVSVNYRSTPDHDALRLLYRNRRTFGSGLETSGNFESLSDSSARGGWTVGKPYLRQDQRLAYGTTGDVGSTRLLRFRDGQLEGEQALPEELPPSAIGQFRRRLFWASAFAAWAPYADPGGYLRLRVAAQVRREDILPEGSTAFPRSVSGAFGGGAEFRRSRFLVVKHYNTFGRDEDVDLSTVAKLEWWVTPAALGYDRDGTGPAFSFNTGAVWGPAFFRFGVDGHAIFGGGGIDSGSVVATGTGVIRWRPRQVFVVHGEIGSKTDPIPGREFDFGLGTGPRGFDAHAFTGTRMAWVTAEYRAFLVNELLDLVGVGVALFGDYGGAWYPDQPRRAGGSLGAGLRIGTSRSASGNVGRIDLAYRFGEGFDGGRWSLVFGRIVTF